MKETSNCIFPNLGVPTDDFQTIEPWTWFALGIPFRFDEEEAEDEYQELATEEFFPLALSSSRRISTRNSMSYRI